MPVCKSIHCVDSTENRTSYPWRKHVFSIFGSIHVSFDRFLLFLSLFWFVLRWVSVLVLVCSNKYTSIFYMLVDSHSAYTYVSKACQITTLNTAMHRNTETQNTPHTTTAKAVGFFFANKKTTTISLTEDFAQFIVPHPFITDGFNVYTTTINWKKNNNNEN